MVMPITKRFFSTPKEKPPTEVEVLLQMGTGRLDATEYPLVVSHLQHVVEESSPRASHEATKEELFDSISPEQRVITNAHEYNPLVADTSAAPKPKWSRAAIDSAYPDNVNDNPYHRCISNK